MAQTFSGTFAALVKKPTAIGFLLLFVYPIGVFFCLKHPKLPVRYKLPCCIIPLFIFSILFAYLPQTGPQSLSLRGSADLSPLPVGQERTFSFIYLPQSASLENTDIVISDDAVLSAKLQAENGQAVLTITALAPGSATAAIASGGITGTQLALTVLEQEEQPLPAQAADAAPSPPDALSDSSPDSGVTQANEETEVSDASGNAPVSASVSEVYITPSGSRYHNSATCGGSASYLVSMDAVGSRTACKKCVPQ